MPTTRPPPDQFTLETMLLSFNNGLHSSSPFLRLEAEERPNVAKPPGARYRGVTVVDCTTGVAKSYGVPQGRNGTTAEMLSYMREKGWLKPQGT